MDLCIPLAILQGIAVTEEEKLVWYTASNILIAHKRYQRLSQLGFEQAIKQVAYRIAKLAGESAIAGLSSDDMSNFQPQTDQLDEIMKTIAKSSGVHPRIVEAYVAFWSDKYTEEFADKYFNQIKS